MKNRYKYTIAALTIAMIATSPAQVYAGDINGNEAGVISAAQGTFEYNGKSYVAKSEYVDQLRGKLSQDGVDLTAVQASEAIAMIYGNVAKGVSDGYLVEVAGSDQPEETGDQPGGTDEPQGENAGCTENPNQPAEGTDGAGQTAEGTGEAGSAENASGTQTENAADTDIASGESETSQTNSQNKNGSDDETSEGNDSKDNQTESTKADLSNIKKRKQIKRPLVVAGLGLIGIAMVFGIVIISKKLANRRR